MPSWKFTIYTPFEEEIFTKDGFHSKEEALSCARKHMKKMVMDPDAYILRIEGPEET